MANNEELQKTAADQNAVEKLAEFLLREEVPSKQLEGVLWGLSELCSELEESRRQLLELQVRVITVLLLAQRCDCCVGVIFGMSRTLQRDFLPSLIFSIETIQSYRRVVYLRLTLFPPPCYCCMTHLEVKLVNYVGIRSRWSCRTN